MKKFLNWLKDEESGQGMVEYGLIIVVIALAVIASMTLFKNSLDNMFNKAGNAVTNTY